MEFNFVEKFNQRWGMLRITTEVVARDHSYFLVVDGTHTFDDSTEQNWGNPYIEFKKFSEQEVRRHFTPVSIKEITPTRVEYEIGNIFDLVKNA